MAPWKLFCFSCGDEEGRRVDPQDRFSRYFASSTHLFLSLSLSVCLFRLANENSAGRLRAPPERQSPRLDPPAPFRLQDVDRRELFFFNFLSLTESSRVLLTLLLSFLFFLSNTLFLTSNAQNRSVPRATSSRDSASLSASRRSWSFRPGPAEASASRAG